MTRLVMTWRESVYRNGFRCPDCGSKLYDMDGDRPTENLAFDPASATQGPSMEAECRCKKCGACVAVTEAMEIAEPSVEAREKVEIRMYGVGIHSDEAWVWLTTREERFRRILRKANVKATHMDPLGRFHVFLFLTPKARDKAFDILKRHFETAFAIYTPLLAVMPDEEETNVYRKRKD